MATYSFTKYPKSYKILSLINGGYERYNQACRNIEYCTKELIKLKDVQKDNIDYCMHLLKRLFQERDLKRYIEKTIRKAKW